MPVNDGQFLGWPFVNHAMEVRGTQTSRGTGRQTIVYPRRKFTYVVEFAINPRALNPSMMQTNLLDFLRNGRIYATLKSIDHPKPSFQTEKLRSYNKDVIVPMKTEYAPAAMAFHDDNSSIAAALWKEMRAYYQYEGRIGANAVRNNAPNSDMIREFRQGAPLTNANGEVRTSQQVHPSMGMTLKPDDGRHFFDSIVIYDLGSDPDSVNIYSYLYPMVTSLDHDSLDYEDRAANVGMNMTFDYEGYYQLVGMNNSQFHQVLETFLGFRPNTPSPPVQGHARMTPPTGQGISVGTGITDTLVPSIINVPGFDPSTIFNPNEPPVVSPEDLIPPPVSGPFPIPEIQPITTTILPADPIVPVDPTDITGFPTGVIGPPPA